MDHKNCKKEVECEHKRLAFCKKCGVVWCKDCKKEWPEKEYAYNWQSPHSWKFSHDIPCGDGNSIPLETSDCSHIQ